MSAAAEAKATNPLAEREKLREEERRCLAQTAQAGAARSKLHRERADLARRKAAKLVREAREGPSEETTRVKEHLDIEIDRVERGLAGLDEQDEAARTGQLQVRHALANLQRDELDAFMADAAAKAAKAEKLFLALADAYARAQAAWNVAQQAWTAIGPQLVEAEKERDANAKPQVVSRDQSAYHRMTAPPAWPLPSATTAFNAVSARPACARRKTR